MPAYRMPAYRMVTPPRSSLVDLEPENRRDHEERLLLPRRRLIAQHGGGILRLDEQPVRNHRDKTAQQQVPVGQLCGYAKWEARLVEILHLREDPILHFARMDESLVDDAGCGRG